MEIEASERRIYEDKISHPEEKKLALLRVTGPTSFVFHAHQHLTPTSTSESLRQKLEVQLYSEFQASSSTKHHPKTPTNHQPKHTQPLRVYTQPDTDIMGCTPSKTPSSVPSPSTTPTAEKRKTFNGGVSIHNNGIAGIGGGPGGSSGGGGGGVLGEDFGGGGDESFGIKGGRR